MWRPRSVPRPPRLAQCLRRLLRAERAWRLTTKLTPRFANRRLKWPLAFAAALVLVPVAQLIPLPTPIWRLLPGREVISETYRLIEQNQPLLPLTMSPTATWLSGLAMLPPIAIFLGSLTLDCAQRRMMSGVVIVVSVISVFLGLLQLAQGPNSALRFFEITNRTEAVGFFANRNHFAALLYSAMLFAAVWLVDATIEAGLQPRRRVIESTTIFLFVCSFVAFVALVAAQMMTRSRAGLGLSIVVLFAALAIGMSDRRASASCAISTKITIGAAAVAIIISLQLALYRILERFGPDVLADARVPFARNTIAAAKAYMPFGSGLGTFVPVYQLFEKSSDVAVAYANHAHNDLLEVWLETGIAGPLLISVFLFWFVRRVIAAWGTNLRIGDFDRALVRAATVIIALLIAHCFVDYPLRTNAMMAVAAFSVALLVPPVKTEGPHRRRRNGKSPLKRQGPRHENAGSEFRERADRDVAPHPREAWGQSIEWPEPWRQPMPPTTKKD
jgi:O-antigen ligase